MGYVIHYDVAAMIVFITILINYRYRKTISTYQSKAFYALLWVSIITTELDIITVLTIDKIIHVPIGINYLVNELYYIFVYVMLPLAYYAYIKICISKDKQAFIKNKAILIPAIISTILIILTDVNKFIFYINENGEFVYGKLRIFLYVVMAMYVGIAIISTYLNRKHIALRQEIFIYAFTISLVIAMIVQIFNASLLLVQFALSIALLLAYLALENPGVYEDKQLGIYNKNAFKELYNQHIINKVPFKVLIIKLKGIKYITEIFGNDSADDIYSQVVESLVGINKELKLFRISETKFALASRKKSIDWNLIQQEIINRFDRPFHVEGGETILSEVMCMLEYPEKITGDEDIFELIEYSIEKATTLGDNSIIFADDSIMDKGRRENNVIQIMRKALREKTFMVYYQPIFSVEKNCYAAAEALIRLKDEKLGFISPDEFIPLAEKNGMILDIGEYVFREVCSFLVERKLWLNSIEYIDVNLSVVQCMQEKLHEKLISIMDEYNLEYKYINLEITETAAIMSSETLESNMAKLMDKGIKFSLDDYGTGFSNISTLIRYNFHTIKLDKSMVWAAMENKKAKYALEYTIGMIKAMNMELIAEGVETKEQVDELAKLGCDYFQGYYYSRPICKEEFYATLKN